MPSIHVDVNLYGALARFGGGKYVANVKLELPAGSTKNDLLAHLGIKAEERGYLFINAVLHDVPGLTTDCPDPLQEGDHVGIFSRTHMWPYQYRDGVRMSPALTAALAEHGAMHHSYQTVSK
jgi:hypothetical protein